ncbi:DUF2715 domain-containing protein [Treponema pedis]|nr:DUF2715 domain-containing protein [Treponema pedis]
MKKIIFILAALCCAATLPAFNLSDISGDVSIGYMNHTMVTTYNSETIKQQLEVPLQTALGTGNLTLADQKSTDVYNAFVAGLSLKISYLYLNLGAGFPSKSLPTGFDPLGAKLKAFNVSDKIKGSVIIDGLLGAGVTLFKNTPFNIVLGGGLGVNYIRTKRDLPEAFVKTIVNDKGEAIAKQFTEIRSTASIGVGADIGIRYYFTKNIGVSFDIKDTVYFLPVMNQRYYNGTLVNGQAFTYTITKEQKQDIKSLIKYQWSNNFTARLGIAWKL